MTAPPAEFAIIGTLAEDFILTDQGRAHLGLLGGCGAYAAAGARVWSGSVALLGRISVALPEHLLDRVTALGVQSDHVVRVDASLPRRFVAHLSPEARAVDSPATHFLRLGIPLPKELLDHVLSNAGHVPEAGLSPLAPRPQDLPPSMTETRGVHLTPGEFTSHALLPDALRARGVRVVTVDPSPAYMRPAHLESVKTVVNGLDAFLPSEEEAYELFLSSKKDPRETAEALGDMGCRFVVVKRGAQGQLLWDATARRAWHIPSYPARVVDPWGAGDAYGGGFLVGLTHTGDPVEAALRGSVAASLAIEGTGPGYLLDTLPGLPQARLDALRPSVRRL
jgi:sugar/nucleoside kinase (ribokinase family)